LTSDRTIAVGFGTANGVFIANLISKSKYYMELMMPSIIPGCCHAKIAQKQQVLAESELVQEVGAPPEGVKSVTTWLFAVAVTGHDEAGLWSARDRRQPVPCEAIRGLHGGGPRTGAAPPRRCGPARCRGRPAGTTTWLAPVIHALPVRRFGLCTGWSSLTGDAPVRYRCGSAAVPAVRPCGRRRYCGFFSGIARRIVPGRTRITRSAQPGKRRRR